MRLIMVTDFHCPNECLPIGENFVTPPALIGQDVEPSNSKTALAMAASLREGSGHLDAETSGLSQSRGGSFTVLVEHIADHDLSPLLDEMLSYAATYFPKGTDLTTYGPEDVHHVAHKLNARQRKTLDWDTPAERLSDLLIAS